MDAVRPQLQFANRVLMASAAPLNGGDRLANFSLGFEIAEQENIVREIADVNRTLQWGANGAGLSENHQREDAAIAKVGQKLMQMHRQKLFSGHGLEISVQAVEHNNAGVCFLDVLLNAGDQFSRRHFGRIDRAGW